MNTWLGFLADPILLGSIGLAIVVAAGVRWYVMRPK